MFQSPGCSGQGFPMPALLTVGVSCHPHPECDTKKVPRHHPTSPERQNCPVEGPCARVIHLLLKRLNYLLRCPRGTSGAALVGGPLSRGDLVVRSSSHPDFSSALSGDGQELKGRTGPGLSLMPGPSDRAGGEPLPGRVSSASWSPLGTREHPRLAETTQEPGRGWLAASCGKAHTRVVFPWLLESSKTAV